MAFSAKFKKRLKVSGLVLLLVVVAVLSLGYYLATYRLKSAIQYAVTKASNGTYAFEAEKTRLSIWDKTFTVKHAKLYCLDTVNTDQHYEVKVKDIFFSISSLSDLVFNKKVMVDSLLIVEPSVDLHVHVLKQPSQKDKAFQMANMLNNLQQALKKFNAKSLVIKDAAFKYGVLNGPEAFNTDHINIAFTNLSEIRESDDHISWSDNVTLNMGRQNWIFPDGHHRLGFKSLSFDGKARRFELDSFSFHRATDAVMGETVISARKFFASSQQLSAIYMRNELIIDSMVCIDPVIVLPTPSGTNQKVKDSAAVVKYIFDLIRVKYIDIQNGEVIIKNKNGQSDNASGRKSNLSVYNLNFNPAATQPVSTDSIKLDLSDIVLLSKDSLTQLSIGKFSFKHDNLAFEQVVFEPTTKRQTEQGVRFTAPLLLIKNFSLDDLMHKRIKASEAELVKPKFSLVSLAKGTGKSKVNKDSSEHKMALFYQTLHGLQDLIDVHSFKIIDGSATFDSKGRQPISMSIGRLNALILLNQLLVSDSLINIKHAMPYINFADNHIKAPGMDITLGNYRFDGQHRHNHGDGLTVKLNNGTTIKGRGIYWELFDWDVFEKTKDIQIDVLKIAKLSIHSSGAGDKEHSPVKKELPVIRIGQLNVAEADFTGEGNATVGFGANNISITDIRSAGNELTWGHATAGIKNLKLRSTGLNATARSVSFDNQQESSINGISFESANENTTATITAPFAKIRSGINSTDLRKLEFTTVWLDNPSVIVAAHKTSFTDKPAKASGKPVNLLVKDLMVYQGAINYTSVVADDTISFKSHADLHLNDLVFSKDKNAILKFDALDFDLTDASLDKTGIGMQIPRLSVGMKNGKGMAGSKKERNFSAATLLSWEKINLQYTKDSTRLSISNLSGTVSDKQFSLGFGKKLSWQSLMQKASITEAGASYRDKKITAGVEKISWNPTSDQLLMTGFLMDPLLGRDETFHTDQWQKDYIRLKGDTLRLSGIKIGEKGTDSMINVRKIIVSRAGLDVSRDKNIPFHHGIEKPMPTRLIRQIPVPLTVDTIVINQADITYNEHAVSTGKWSSIPLKSVTGYLLNVSNRAKMGDSLHVYATAGLLDNQIRHFSYTESYQDSLSGFRARSNMAPIQLTRLSEVAVPMANVSVTTGIADTMFAYWEGNKYASYGDMNFYYHHLKIKILSKDSTGKKTFKSSVLTFIANLILPNKKNKPSVIFVERDQEKFIFNYWIKAHASGLMSTIGIKRNNKYRKLFRKKQQQYSLPQPGKSL